MENRIENDKQMHIEYLNKQSDIKSSISVLNEVTKNINNRIKQLNFDNDLLTGQYEEKLNIKERIEKEILLILDKIEKNKNTEELYIAEKKLKENQIHQIEEILIKIRSNKDNILSRLKLLEEMEKEYGGYNKTIKNVLTQQHSIRGMVKGFRGVVGELVSVPEAYAIAIEAALGSAVQNIVTDCEEDAKKLIEFLKKNNMGRATFLPISSIKSRGVNYNELKRLKYRVYCMALNFNMN